MSRGLSVRTQFLGALLASSAVSIILLLWYAFQKGILFYDFMVWNLFLAWLPLLFSLRLVKVLRRKVWSSWEAIGLTLLWLLFLPNAFYMVSDFIHLRTTSANDVLFVAVMFSSFICTALVLGFASLFLVHRELVRRFTNGFIKLFLGVTLFLCSAAIYIGRDLRWNSWDVFLNPGGVLFDISDRILRPQDYPQMFVTIFSFFIFLASSYFVAWRLSRLLQALPKS